MNTETLLTIGLGLSVVRIILIVVLVVLAILILKAVWKIIKLILSLPVILVKGICGLFTKKAVDTVEKETKKVEKKVNKK